MFILNYNKLFSSFSLKEVISKMQIDFVGEQAHFELLFQTI